jgi:hypothetical protein
MACSPVPERYQVVKSWDEGLRMRTPSTMALVIGIGKNNCARSEERKGKQLHPDTSVSFSRKNIRANEDWIN